MYQKLEKEEIERKKKEDADALRQTFVEMTKEYLRLPEVSYFPSFTLCN